jgi:hypothetical protein
MSRRQHGKEDDLTVTAQIRISPRAKDLITKRAEKLALTPSAYVRRLLYHDLGIIKE